MSTKRVLMICCGFPPVAGIGTHRSLKFVTYLPAYGWQPFVVGATRSYQIGDIFDETMLKELPKGILVKRVVPLRPPSIAYKVDKIFAFVNNHLGSRIIGRVRAVIKRRLELLDGLIRCTPDPYLYWAISSIPICLWLIKKYKINVIYATTWPHSSLLLGLLLKNFTSKPLVVDYRDPWSSEPFFNSNNVRGRICRFLDGIVLKKADRVISVNKVITSELFRVSGKEEEGKFLTITHGFDSEDFPEEIHSDSNKSSQDSRITISYVGRVYKKTAIPFFKALALIRNTDKQKAGKIFVRFVGHFPPEDHEYLVNSPIKDQVEILSRTTHVHAIRYMLNSEILLFLQPEEEWAKQAHGGKLFEYIYAKAPILALAPKGLASELIQQTGTGITISPSDIEGIANILRKIAVDYEGFKREYFHPNEEAIIKFDRKKLTQRLAEVFDSLVI